MHAAEVGGGHWARGLPGGGVRYCRRDCFSGEWFVRQCVLALKTGLICTVHRQSDGVYWLDPHSLSLFILVVSGD